MSDAPSDAAATAPHAPATAPHAPATAPHAAAPAPGTPASAADEVTQREPERPSTGDRAVDDALSAFDRALSDGPAAQAEAAAEAHRTLQARLTAPTPPAAPPGEARPGPRR